MGAAAEVAHLRCWFEVEETVVLRLSHFQPPSRSGNPQLLGGAVLPYRMVCRLIRRGSWAPGSDCRAVQRKGVRRLHLSISEEQVESVRRCCQSPARVQLSPCEDHPRPRRLLASQGVLLLASSGLGSSWAEQVGMRTRNVAANRRKQASLTLHHSKVVMLHLLEFSEIDTARAYVVPGQLVKHRHYTH